MSNPNATRDVRIIGEYGLHMRPAELFSKAAMRFSSDIRVLHVARGAFADGKSLLDLMMLAAEHGTVIRIQAEGPDAEAAVNFLGKLVESDFRNELAG